MSSQIFFQHTRTSKIRNIFSLVCMVSCANAGWGSPALRRVSEEVLCQGEPPCKTSPRHGVPADHSWPCGMAGEGQGFGAHSASLGTQVGLPTSWALFHHLENGDNLTGNGETTQPTQGWYTAGTLEMPGSPVGSSQECCMSPPAGSHRPHLTEGSSSHS